MPETDLLEQYKAALTKVFQLALQLRKEHSLMPPQMLLEDEGMTVIVGLSRNGR